MQLYVVYNNLSINLKMSVVKIKRMEKHTLTKRKLKWLYTCQTRSTSEQETSSAIKDIT